MKRATIIIASILILTLTLWFVSNWLANGGWPSSGPVGEKPPPHIQYTNPKDGQQVGEIYSFCVHFNYLAGHGLGDEPLELMRFYFDGRNVTSRVVDIIRLEYGYPDPVGEPCYSQSTPLKSGWHTVKITYEDLTGERFKYMWRFQVVMNND